MARYKVLVLSNCVAGREAEYNAYYDNQHIPDILRELPEVQSAQRFQLEPVRAAEGQPEWRFSCLYEIETENFSQYLSNMQRALVENRIPPSDAAIADSSAVFKLIPLTEVVQRK